MKFKDKDGNVFEDINELGEIYCRAHMCSGRVKSEDMCPMLKAYKASGYLNCISWQNDHPAEAARLMGYEVVVEDEERCEDRECAPPYGDKEDCDLREGGYCKAVKKEDNMDNMDKQKPPSEWTLGEVKAVCAARGSTCEGCALITQYDDCLFAHGTPEDWDFTPLPRFTEEEVADARAIMRMIPKAASIERVDMCSLRVRKDEAFLVWINYEMFPSILPGQSVELSDIVGGAK